MRGPSKRITEMEWTDPREGRSWLVRTYWTGEGSLGAKAGFESRDGSEKSEARIIFLYPPDLGRFEETHVTRNPTERTAGELSERDLMDLLDQARKVRR